MIQDETFCRWANALEQIPSGMYTEDQSFSTLHGHIQEQPITIKLRQIITSILHGTTLKQGDNKVRVVLN